MQQQGKIDGSGISGISPSFSCYSSDSLTSMAVAKVIREEAAARFNEFGDVDVEDFEFSLVLSDEEVSTEENDSRGWSTVFPVFNRDLLVKEEEDREVKSKDNEIDVSASVTNSLRKLFIDERDESSSCSSSEADESESPHTKAYCVWRPKADGGSSPSMTKCKKSSSTGSVSKRWSIRYLLRRSNSERKEPMVLLTPKKIDSPKQRRNSGEVSKVAGRLKAQTPLHEQFYVQKRAESEVVKRKTYLPYRRDLVGFFSNVNGMGKMLPF
ncbi:hypothetical protein L2E82_44354 [Cichorium intybus]|uniref:Uncharacterized protein n=1 Tax=Cichorium intybus TaxID=13427 RepID=A0ACB8ZR62_CICIN|nr:hypothetical protein L2E82_44354 [Cichorium intybus]